MKRVVGVLFFIIPFITGCSNGGGSTSTLPTVAAPAVPQTEAQSDAQQMLRTPLATTGANDLLYIGNAGNNSITVYRHDATGNTPPLYTIAGSRTGIHHPGQLSQDAQGNLYVANGGKTEPASEQSVLVFAHGATGNVAPIRKLFGARTGFHIVTTVSVDRTTGKIYVVDLDGPEGFGAALLRFAPNATGDVAPFARGALPRWANQIASDSSGKNIIISEPPECCSTATAGVDTFVKQFSNAANLTSMYSIFSLQTFGVADDPTTKTYLTTGGAGLVRFAETTTGYGPDNLGGKPPKYAPSIVSAITSETCGEQLAVAPGATPNTYVVHDCGDGHPAVRVYANNANGNATPLRVLSGSATTMSSPAGITEGP